MKQKPKRRRSVIVRLIVLGVAIYSVVTLFTLSNELAMTEAERDSGNKDINTLELEIEELQALLDSGSYDDIIEKAARERLGYVYSDEEIYIDTSGN